jgi:hypothetical protein
MITITPEFFAGNRYTAFTSSVIKDIGDIFQTDESGLIRIFIQCISVIRVFQVITGTETPRERLAVDITVLELI